MHSLAYRDHHTPIGALRLYATERGLIYLAFETETVDDWLCATLSRDLVSRPSLLDGAVRELDAYFSGSLRDFDLPIDDHLLTGFRGRAQSAMADIPYGQTRSYADLAAAAGSPRATQAAGTACARNPFPIVLPCHRVVRSDGSYGAYRGGADAKTWLLKFESGNVSTHNEVK